MFKLDERVVYPGYGVAKINRLIKRKIAGNHSQFFELNLLKKDMTVFIPVKNIAAIGIRKLSDLGAVAKVWNLLAEPVSEIHGDAFLTNWNKRNKEYQEKLRNGNIVELTMIYRDLKIVGMRKELSFSERALLQQTEALLVEEIALGFKP